MDNQLHLVATARSYLGTRFVHQGRSKETGVDCLGLLLCAAQDAGLRFGQYDRRDYRIFPEAQLLRQLLEEALEPVDVPQSGDVALFRIAGRPQHLALITDYPAADTFGMLHAYAPLRKVVEHRFDVTWQKRVEQVFRIPSDPEGRRTT